MPKAQAPITSAVTAIRFKFFMLALFRVLDWFLMSVF